MKIVSIINYKGGVGKTTVTANLAGELAYRGKKVLLLDMDAQASLTFSFVRPDYWEENLKENRTIKNWFDSISGQNEETISFPNLIFSPEEVNMFLASSNSDGNGSIDLISSHLGLINVDLDLATQLGGANMGQSKRNYIKVHGKLRSELRHLASEYEYDIILIDCPPNFNIVTKNALIASDQILIPAKPDYLSTLGIDYLIGSVQNLVKEFNEYASMGTTTEEVNPEMLGVIFTMVQYYSGKPIVAQRQYIMQTKRLKVHVMSTMFRENKSIFADAPQNSIPVVLNVYNNKSHSNVVAEIEELASEFLTLSRV